MQEARRDFARAISKCPTEDLIFVDEFGFNHAMTRSFARAPRGIRAYSAVPFNPGENITLTMGLSLRGVVAPFAAPGGTDGFFFRSYVERVLVPELRPGNIVLFDNLSAHKVVGVREAIEATGARLILLPPYSPDLSPIENCGAKIKTLVRGEAARSRQAVYDAMGRAMHKVTMKDASGWFINAGYSTKAA